MYLEAGNSLADGSMQALRPERAGLMLLWGGGFASWSCRCKAGGQATSTCACSNRIICCACHGPLLSICSGQGPAGHHVDAAGAPAVSGKWRGSQVRQVCQQVPCTLLAGEKAYCRPYAPAVLGLHSADPNLHVLPGYSGLLKAQLQSRPASHALFCFCSRCCCCSQILQI